MQNSIIVYDLDGTLAHTEVYWLPFVEYYFERAEQEYGWRPAVEKREDVLDFLGRPLRTLIESFFPQVDAAGIDQLVQLEKDCWHTEAGKHPFVLYPGTLETLAELQAQGMRQFIASNCNPPYLERMLAETGIGPYIEDGACREIWPGLEKWGFTQRMLENRDYEKGYFIGDSWHDMEAGRKNGLTTIHAAYGYAPTPAPDLIDYSLGDIRQLPELLASI